MAESEVSKPWHASFQWTILAPLQTVWRLTSNFAAIDKWAPSVVARSIILDGAPQQVGCLRYVEGPPSPTLGSPPHAQERLLEMDVENFKYKYQVLECSFSLLVGAVATFQLADTGKNGTEIMWTCEVAPIAGFEEEIFRSAVRALYEPCIADLKRTLSIEL